MRTYVVTGSASGIGRAAATQLLAAGHRVIGADLRDAEVTIDLAATAGRTALVSAVADRTDVVDGIIAAAGVGGRENPPELVVRVNYFGVVDTVTGLLPWLERSEAPRVAVVASSAVLRGIEDNLFDACLAGDEEQALRRCGTANPSWANYPYSTVKRALSTWVRRQAVAPSWVSSRILVNAVAPGIIRTPMTEYLLGSGRAEQSLSAFGQPLGPGHPDDVASLLTWLTSTANGLVTGQTIFIDGGHEALRGAGLPRLATPLD